MGKQRRTSIRVDSPEVDFMARPLSDYSQIQPSFLSGHDLGNPSAIAEME